MDKALLIALTAVAIAEGCPPEEGLALAGQALADQPDGTAAELVQSVHQAAQRSSWPNGTVG